MKSPKRRETPVAPKAVDKAVQVAVLVAAMRSRMFREHLSSMAPLATESDRVHLASSAVCAVTDDPKMVKTLFAPEGNGNERIGGG